MYLNRDAVDSTLDLVVQHSGPGSAIVFDYLYRSLLDGVQKQNEIDNMRRYRFMTGEGLTFGIPEGMITTFLEERGFASVQDVNADDLKAAYCTGKNAGRTVVGGYGIALARI